MKILVWFNNEKFRILLLILLAMLVRMICLLSYENMPGIAISNVLQSLSVIDYPGFRHNFNGNCSMLYVYFLAIFLSIWRDPMLLPKIITVVFGILVVLPFYGCIKVIFSKRIAFLSCLILAFYPLHVVQSCITTSEAMYYFFIFSALYFFLDYISKTPKTSSFILSALAFNIAALLRFECWLFIPIFFFILLNKNKKSSVLFLGLLLIAPVAWLALNYFVFNLPFYTFERSAQTSNMEIMEKKIFYDPSLWSWLSVLWRSSGGLFLIGGLLGMITSIKLSGQKLFLAYFFVIGFTSLSVNSFIAHQWHHEKYSLILGLLLIPYAVFLFDHISDRFLQKKWWVYSLLLILLLINFYHIAQTRSVSLRYMNSVSTEDINDLSRWLRENLSSGRCFFIDWDPFAVYWQSIILKSGFPKERYQDIGTTYFQSSFQNSAGSFETFIKDQQPEYVVLNSKGPVQKVMNFDFNKKILVFGDITLEAVFTKDLGGHGKYQIYHVAIQRKL